ncbi:MAG: 5-carboxymethyl-2-hydroxymuconate Delta-isomerase [Ectothiorhodospiraceae bacterium]|nr:5-carboxymethyl-2-hydroxymuconate Delta-isomerase [Ectothiorhodospiraceae bacterium]
MPHFLIDCSESIFRLQSEEQIIEQVHFAAKSTELFNENDIKVRVNSFKKYSTGNKIEDFIHVFSNIMEGRSNEQKANLTKKIVQELTSILPTVPNIGANIIEFENANYCNRNILQTRNFANK